MGIGGSSTAARSAARSMIFRPRTDELAPRAGICTHVCMYPVAESRSNVAGREGKKERKRDGSSEKKERERKKRQGRCLDNSCKVQLARMPATSEGERERKREREKDETEGRKKVEGCKGERKGGVEGTDVANARGRREERTGLRGKERRRRIEAKGARGEDRRRRERVSWTSEERESVRVTSARPGPIKGAREENREGGGEEGYAIGVISLLFSSVAPRCATVKGTTWRARADTLTRTWRV